MILTLHRLGYRFTITEQRTCPRCDGEGIESSEQDWLLHLPLLGTVNVYTSTVTSVCNNCDGEGDIENTRPRRLDELYDSHIQFLFEADLYRELGDEEDRQQMQEMKKKAERQRRSRNTPVNIPNNI